MVVPIEIDDVSIEQVLEEVLEEQDSHLEEQDPLI